MIPMLFNKMLEFHVLKIFSLSKLTLRVSLLYFIIYYRCGYSESDVGALNNLLVLCSASYMINKIMAAICTLIKYMGKQS